MQQSTQQPTQTELLAGLRRSATIIQTLQQELTSYQEPIAVIGMGCRFPGDVHTPAAYWEMLRAGVSAWGEAPWQRWQGCFTNRSNDPVHKKQDFSGHYLAEVGYFDAQFFGISPREAIGMDPQQQLLLEVGIEALEHANLPIDGLLDSRTGVYVGLMNQDYQNLQQSGADIADIDIYTGFGGEVSFLAGRLSYHIGLRGPSMMVGTACSSSLVTTHLACQALRAKECDLALSGGVSLILSSIMGVALAKMQATAVDGLSKTFDASANGYGRGEGCGILVLKRLSDAQRDGDTIWAVIRGSAVNHDGRSGGLTVPSGPAQEILLRQALSSARITANQVSFIEAHGTGTALGDPIEIRALGNVFCKNRQTPLFIGSAKTNIGHLEPAAGVAGLMKVILALRHKEIPPHLHFQQPNPHIPWQQYPIQIPTKLTEWSSDIPRMAGVSSFGLSGINAHVILEEAPVPAIQNHLEQPTRFGTANAINRLAIQTRPLQLLTLSAKTPQALQALVARYRDLYLSQPAIDLGDLCYTAHIGRSHYSHRLSIVAGSFVEIEQKLSAYIANHEAIDTSQTSISPQQAPVKVAFLFTGQGAQYVNMGRELYESQPTFRQIIDHCDELLQAQLSESILKVLYPAKSIGADEASKIDNTTYTQPALFVLEYALATLWQSWGIEPEILIGHSVGEVVAACVAGVFSLEDGLKLIAARGRLMGALPQDGEMLSVMSDEAHVQQGIAPYPNEVSIAALNGPQSVVISGKRETVLAIAEQFAAEGIKCRKLTVSHAFHSPLMEPMLVEFRQVAASITYHKPKLPMVSNLTGKLAGDEISTPDYWVRHVREAVRFADGVQTLHQQGIGIFLEIGPKPVLLGMAEQGASSKGQVPEVNLPPATCNLPSLREGQSDWQQMLTSLGELYVRGVRIDWVGFDRDYQRRKIVLPTYPFQRQRYWLDSAKQRQAVTGLRPLIDKKTYLPHSKQTVFEKAFSTDTLPFLADHHVYGEVVVPGACYLALALSAADLLFNGAPCVLEDVIFPQPLVLLPEQARTIQLVSESQLPLQGNHHGNVATSFQIISFSETETEIEPLLHATGQIARTDATVSQVSLTSLRSRCQTPVEPAAFYKTMAQTEIVFGPTFRWLTSVWRGVAGEAISLLCIPDALTTTEGYPLFPTLLDAAFQLVGIALTEAVSADTKGSVLLPFALESLTLYRPTDPQDLWCHVKQTDENRWQITLLNASGDVCAVIRGFQMRAVPPESIQGNRLHADWLYTLDWQDAPFTERAKAPHTPDCWLIVGAQEDIGEALVQTLRADSIPVISLAAEITSGDMAGLRQIVSELTVQYRTIGVVYLGILAEDFIETTSSTTNVPAQTHDLCCALLHLTQVLLNHTATIHLWVVTQGSQVVGEEMLHHASLSQGRPALAAAGALWGLGRTIAQEQPQLHTVCIDLEDSSNPQQQAALLQQEFCYARLSAQVENQIAFRQGTRYVARLKQWHAPILLNKAQPQRLQLNEYGTLEHLSFVPLPRRKPKAGEVEVEVTAAGLNFRDVMNALGMLQTYYADVLGIRQAKNVGLGLECAGVVTAVGEDVSGLTVGDRVMGLGAGAGTFASYITLPASQMVTIPAHLSDAEAATLPLTFLTAWYGLVELANLQPGERVLIHAASGGVGQAAVQVAQAIGAEVIATASPAKWDFLRQQGIRHIFNSRTLTFSDEILHLTASKGVDVVFNSLNGDFIERSFAVLSQHGRFVEIGKLGIWSHEQVKAYRPDAAYYPYDLGEAMTKEPTLQMRLWQAFLQKLHAGILKPLPYTLFPAHEIVTAFRTMQQSKQIGKIVIDFAQPKPVILQPDATYLITGGLGALGLQVAQQFVEEGAKHLVLSGRRGVTHDVQRQMIAKLTESGATVHVMPADIVDREAVRLLLDNCATIAPLRGIVHTAGLLDDGILTEQTASRFATVMRPKVHGTWHLHTLTEQMNLDFFVCFSSAASMLGSAGQSNYAAANAFMDTLMQQRRQRRLPALSINWGAWSEVGMAAHLQERIRAQGMAMISPQQGRLLFRHLLQQPVAQVGVLPIKQERRQEEKPVKRANIRSLLISLPDSERRNQLMEYLQSQIIAVLGLRSDASIAPRTRLFDFGLDSLMAVELKNKLQTGLDCSLRSTLLFDYPTLEVLTPHLLTMCFGENSDTNLSSLPSQDEQKLTQEEKVSSERISYLERLSDDEAMMVLLQKLQN